MVIRGDQDRAENNNDSEGDAIMAMDEYEQMAVVIEGGSHVAEMYSSPRVRRLRSRAHRHFPSSKIMLPHQGPSEPELDGGFVTRANLPGAAGVRAHVQGRRKSKGRQAERLGGVQRAAAQSIRGNGAQLIASGT